MKIEKNMWKSKYDELVSVQADKVALQKEMSGMISRLRDAAALAEDKESEVERLKLKYGDLKQSLDIAEKEREIDLKEREALVYRADSLQREFEHINKLLQTEKNGKVKLEDELTHLKKHHKIQLSDIEKTNQKHNLKLEKQIDQLKELKADEIQKQLEQAHHEIQKIQEESQSEIEVLRQDLTSRDDALSVAQDQLRTFSERETQFQEHVTATSNNASTAELQIGQLKEFIENLESSANQTRAKFEADYKTAVETANAQLAAERDVKEKLTAEIARLKALVENMENQISNLRESVLSQSEAASAESEKIQSELISENKNFRSQVAAFRAEIEEKLVEISNIKSSQSEAEKLVQVRNEEINRLKIEMNSVNQSLEHERALLAENKGDFQSNENSLREQMSKMQERLNVAELQRTATSNELGTIKSDNQTLESEMEKLTGNFKIISAENEKLKAELEQVQTEHSRLQDKYQEMILAAETPAETAPIDISDEVENSEVILAMRQELRILREKNQILESKYKLNRRISPRAAIKAGKTIDPPPMAPPSDYVSADENNQIDEKQLKVLRQELRQREDLVSRLVSDVENMKITVSKKDQEISKVHEKYDSLSADYSANLVLIDEYEKSDGSLRKELRKFRSQISGTYDGDEDLKQLLKDKIQEIESIKTENQNLEENISKLKKSLSRRKRKEKKLISEKSTAEICEEAVANLEDVPESVPKPAESNLNPVDNPDEYIACSIQ